MWPGLLLFWSTRSSTPSRCEPERGIRKNGGPRPWRLIDAYFQRFTNNEIFAFLRSFRQGKRSVRPTAGHVGLDFRLPKQNSRVSAAVGLVFNYFLAAA